MTNPRSQSIFTRGAVDLGALRSSPAPAGSAPPRPSPGPATGAGALVIDVSEATFQTEVLERSLSTPVVIDFWAEWCQPCKQLSPILEKLAVEGGGAWVLAKVDVDANPRLAQMFRVQGIPMVYAVVGGQPVDGFSGAMPESQLRQWLSGILRAGGVSVTEPEDPTLLAADDAMMSGDLEAAEQAYRKILNERPGDSAAEAGLAQVELMRRITGVDPSAVLATAASAPDDIAAQTLAADVEMVTGHAGRAYDRLIELVRRTAGDEREKARRHLLSLFVLAGPEDPDVARARRKLANALF